MYVINAFQLWSKGQRHRGQLRFREELMHELLKQLPPEQKPHRAGARPNPATTLAKDHFPISTHQDLDCQQCSNRAAARKRSRIICAECGVHLCIGACFSLYHSVA
jgi:ribosomal protein L37AE/L43A